MIGKIGDLLALYDRQADKTDLVEVTDGDLKVVSSIQKEVHFILQHGDRILCDNQVFLKCDYEIIQQLETHSKVTSGAALTRELLALGHASFSRVSLWKWHD